MKRGFLSALSPQSRGFFHVASCHQFLHSEFDDFTLRVSIPTSIEGAAAPSAFRPIVPLLSNPNLLILPPHGNHPTPSDGCTTISEILKLEDEEDDELPDAFDELFCEDLLFESLEIYFSEGFNRLVDETNSTTTSTTTDQTSPPNTLAKQKSPLEVTPGPSPFLAPKILKEIHAPLLNSDASGKKDGLDISLKQHTMEPSSSLLLLQPFVGGKEMVLDLPFESPTVLGKEVLLKPSGLLFEGGGIWEVIVLLLGKHEEPHSFYVNDRCFGDNGNHIIVSVLTVLWGRPLRPPDIRWKKGCYDAVNIGGTILDVKEPLDVF